MTKNKTILITGGAKRIGLAICRYLHDRDYNLIVTYNRSSKEANTLKKELNESRANSCDIVKMNFTGSTNFSKFYKQIMRSFGRVDVLINNASKFYPTKMPMVNEKNWNDLINTNLKTPLFLSKVFKDELKKQKGSIINIIDIHADPPLKDHIIYNISKAGLLSLTKTLAKDLAPHIRVNGVSPGAIMWPKQDLSNVKKQNEILSRIPLKRAGVPNNIAEVVLFLIEHSDYITGQNIDVDGGRKLNM